MNPTDDDRIRDLFDDAVSDVEPRHGLGEIHSRTAPSRARRPWLWGAGSAVLATAATIAVVAAMSGGPGTTDADPGFAASVAPTTAAAPPADDALAPMQISSPAPGATVDSPFTVKGRAAAFEANVLWELRQGATVVKRGFTTAEECCTLSPYSFEVTAPPGQYTLVVHDEDPSGGEGLPPEQATRDITVR